MTTSGMLPVMRPRGGLYIAPLGDIIPAQPGGPHHDEQGVVADPISIDFARECRSLLARGSGRADTPAQNLSERLNKSQYVVEKGELARRQGSVAATSTSLSHDEEFQVMKKSLVAAKAKATIVEGARVVISDGKEYYE